VKNEKAKKWDNRYLAMAEFVASWSEDPRKQVGSVIVRDNRVISVGYNGLPSGVSCGEDNCRLHDRKVKLEFIEHAERNAIYTASRMGHVVAGSTMYCNWYPCTDCARAIIQSGIIRLVTSAPDAESRWYDKMLLAETMFNEAEVELTYIT